MVKDIPKFDKFVIEDREYSKEEVIEILKQHNIECAETCHHPQGKEASRNVYSQHREIYKL